LDAEYAAFFGAGNRPNNDPTIEILGLSNSEPGPLPSFSAALTIYGNAARAVQTLPK
jgi:hypothetical protein